MSVFADSIGALMLLVSGANVPFDRLPHVVRTVAEGVPLTHGIDAARQVAAGASLADVSGLLGGELVVAAAYLAVGLVLLRVFERQGRVAGSLDRF